MSHNSYQQKLNQVYDDSSRKELEVRGERHFTIDDIEHERKYKWYLVATSFVAGVLFAILVMHFLYDPILKR